MGTLVSANGSYFLKNYFDQSGKPRGFSCRMIHISPTVISLIVPVRGQIGADVSTEFEEFGKLEGKIDRHFGGGFAVRIEATDEARQNLAAKIIWYKKLGRRETANDREHKRIVPKNPLSTIILADGSQHRCFVVDVSASGVRVSAEITPPISTPLAVGKIVGRVVRHLTDGFAVHFAEAQRLGSVERSINYTPHQKSAQSL